MSVLEEYIRSLKENGFIDDVYRCGRFAIVHSKNGLKLLIERQKDSSIVIDEIPISVSDVEALWIVAGHYLSSISSDDDPSLI